MDMVVRGAGVPLVLIPGVQGRWEYMSRAVEALSRVCRVITFSLADEPGSDCPFDAGRRMDSYVDQVERAMDQSAVESAAVCGVSFGGLIAIRFAAERQRRTAALVLASTPGPSWHLSERHRRYVRFPRLAAPLFFAGMPGRLRREITRAIPARRDRLQFRLEAARTFLRAGLSPTRMAARALAIDPREIAGALQKIDTPTLVITGEPSLDWVVPAGGTAEYAERIPGATLVRLDRTGHLGAITRPREFAAIVERFVDGHRHAAA